MIFFKEKIFSDNRDSYVTPLLKARQPDATFLPLVAAPVLGFIFIFALNFYYWFIQDEPRIECEDDHGDIEMNDHGDTHLDHLDVSERLARKIYIIFN